MDPEARVSGLMLLVSKGIIGIDGAAKEILADLTREDRPERLFSYMSVVEKYKPSEAFKTSLTQEQYSSIMNAAMRRLAGAVKNENSAKLLESFIEEAPKYEGNVGRTEYNRFMDAAMARLQNLKRGGRTETKS